VRDGTATDIQWSNDTASLAANWTSVTDTGAGLDRYEYCMSTGVGCTGTILTSPTWTSNALSTSATRAGTYTHGNTYYTTVRAVDNVPNTSGAQPSNGVTIDTVAPTAVTTSGSSPTTSAPSISWSAATDALSGLDYYRIYRSTSSGSLGTQVNTDGATTGTNFTDSTNTTSGTYYYTVRAVDRAGNEQAVGNTQSAIVLIAPIYLRAATSLNSGSWLLSTTPGSTPDTTTDMKIGAQSNWMQLAAGQTYTPTSTASAPASYTGNGWLYDASPGASFQAGTWTHHLTTTATRSHSGFIDTRAWKVTLSSGAINTATPLTGWTEYTGTDVGATTSTQAVDVPVTMPQVSFAAGEYLYVEYWERVVTPASGGGSANTHVSMTVDTASQYIETTAPVPPMSVTNVSPTSLPQSTSAAAFTVTGTGFVAGATVSVSGTGATVNVTGVTPTTVTGTITIASNAAATVRNITVTNPDTSSATGIGLFTVTIPSISVSLSTLGFVDAARDSTAPYAMSMGTPSPGVARQVGPVGSGQTLAGAAVQTTITSDTTTNIQVSATQMTDGTHPIPYANTRIKPSASGTWNTLSGTDTDLDTALPPGTFTRNFDYELTIPVAQYAGTYGQTLTWTVIAQP
jgi:hypothetical protein